MAYFSRLRKRLLLFAIGSCRLQSAFAAGSCAVVTAVLILKYEGVCQTVDFIFYNFSHIFSGGSGY
jgi:hypothetical protein